ncbi:MAG: YtxH domain-containing protein [Gemmatimonadaceae bacterium]
MARSSDTTVSSRSSRTGGATRPNGRGRGTARAGGRGSPPVLHAEPEGKSYSTDLDWGQIGLVGAGVALGIAIGAGVALLMAPRSGEEMREMLSDAVSDRLDTMRTSAGRAATRGRWSADDFRRNLMRRIAR